MCTWCDLEPAPNWTAEPSPDTNLKSCTSMAVIPTDSLAWARNNNDGYACGLCDFEAGQTRPGPLAPLRPLVETLPSIVLLAAPRPRFPPQARKVVVIGRCALAPGEPTRPPAPSV